jgi:aquaporin Z
MGALFAGRIPVVEAVGYWVAQFVGGILGALLLWGTFSSSPLYHRTTTGLGTDGWGAASHIHINAGGAFLAEVVLTAFFVFVILGVTSKIGNTATAGMVIGLSLTAVHLIGIPITGTSVNPARSLGPALIVGGTALHQVWLFIVAPLVGGVLAAGLHLLIYPNTAPDAAPSPEGART